MFLTRTKLFSVSFLLAVAMSGSTVHASVIVGLLLNPASTAGGGATSTRSGYNSWQLYAIESADSTDFGISSYNIVLSGTTAINHRSPRATINDVNGNPQDAGFTLLRSGTNANPIVAAQNLPGTTPFMISGYGQTASDFTTKSTAIDGAAVVVGSPTSGGWGNYNSSVLGPLAASTGHKWVFLAEGLGTNGLAAISSTTFTVYSNQNGTSVSTPSSSNVFDRGPHPSSTIINNVNANTPGTVDYQFFSTLSTADFWSDFSFISGPTPAVPPTFDPHTAKFSWSTVGSPIGTYKWSVLASSVDGVGQGTVTVNITSVPEPATPSLFTMSIVGIISAARRRRA